MEGGPVVGGLQMNVQHSRNSSFTLLTIVSYGEKMKSVVPT